jgi:putative Mg2+ transporter-C (MgtC) family protein
MDLRWDEMDAALRLVAAGLFGAVIGFDRASRQKPADVRTFALVSIGAALFTLVGIEGFGPGDPGSRVAAQIVTGIGFLGAGTIIVLKGQVVGLTTAAGIWTAAAVGMAFGSGLWLLGVAGSILVVVVLRLTALEAVAGDSSSTDGGADERSKPG